ncbi:hypothetical protein M3Y95_00614800 [Aphelenchoides besseyi]|nr:hypothetical protein M3Y95_00614800 [Aphelenchoides besseyi]
MILLHLFLSSVFLSNVFVFCSSVFIFTPPPASRVKGEVACYSCFTTYGTDTSESTAMNQSKVHENVGELKRVISEAGMKIPTLASRCADFQTPGNQNLNGARVHLCVNTVKEPGTCVKLKGFLSNGQAYVYRDCWQRMWTDPRPFHHAAAAGKCFNDDTVQNFIASKDNTICFCEDDLCNVATSFQTPVLFTFLFLVANLFLISFH